MYEYHMLLLLLGCAAQSECASTCSLMLSACGAVQDGNDWEAACADECGHVAADAADAWAECWAEAGVDADPAGLCVATYTACGASPCANGPELAWPEGTSDTWSCE